MLMLTAWVGKQLGIDFTVAGFWPSAFLGALIVSIVSTVLSWFIPDKAA
jgi:putative membrane protein